VLEDYVRPEAPVRVIDAFVDGLGMVRGSVRARHAENPDVVFDRRDETAIGADAGSAAPRKIACCMACLPQDGG
jgi:hypothetical protein